MPIRLFLGSSTAARSQARAFAAAFTSDRVSFLPWWEAFTPGRTLLEELESLRSKVHGAVLVLTPESPAVVRGNDVHIPNLNVLFEFGFFYGQLQKNRVAVVRYGDVYLPSDLEGYVHIFGSKSFKRGGAVKVAQRTASDFARWVSAAPFGKVATSSPAPPPPQVRHVRGTIGGRPGGWVRNW